jgi:hypothetical protein
MKKIVIALMFVLFYVIAAYFSFGIISTNSYSGETVEQKRETVPFRKISTGGGIDVYFTQNDVYSVVVEADEEYIDRIVTKVSGETLVVEWKEEMRFRNFSSIVMKVYVSAPALNEVSMSGGSDFYADNLKCDESFRVNTSGGADAQIQHLTVAGEINILLSGGSDCNIKNLTVTGTTSIETSGGADCDIEYLQTSNCNLSSSGGSDLDINLSVTGNLSVSASGGSDIEISGTANNVQVSASGAADVDIQNLKYTSIDISKSGAADIER